MVKKNKKTDTTCQHKHLIPMVKHDGGGLMIWASFAVTESDLLADNKQSSKDKFVFHIVVKDNNMNTGLNF